MEKSSGQGLRALTVFNPQIVKPKKQLGQHWLKQKSVLNKIINAADLKKSDLIIEIGPGLGILTKELAEKAGKVIAIEKDRELIPILGQNLKEFGNINIVNEDILRIVSPNPKTHIDESAKRVNTKRETKNTKYQLPATKYKVVANLPYYIAAKIIRNFLEAKNPPELMVLMLQKEVAQRICPVKPKPKMNLLAISVQFYADAKIIDYVSKNAFWPKPKVDSAIIKITPHQLPKTSDRLFLVMSQSRGKKLSSLSYGREKGIQITRTNNYFLNEKNKRLFFKIVKAGFSQPRKQLINNLASGLGLPKSQIKDWLLKNKLRPEQRAESLAMDNWLALTKTL